MLSNESFDSFKTQGVFHMDILLAAANPSYSAVTGTLSIESLTYYLFWLACVCMGAATLFFFLERSNVPAKYRTTLTVSGLITGIACFHYFRMAGIYEGGGFPTEYRYIDWIITTPLMLIKFPLLLGLGAKGKKLFAQLVILDLFMIATAYVAEVSAVGGPMWWSFFLIACLAELLIVATLYFQMSDAILDAPQPIARAVRLMRSFILVGWAIYPVGFLMALTGESGGALRELFYNVADVINKVGFGLVAYHGIKAIAEVDRSMGLNREDAVST
jgi:bacteriorhodopsin